MATIFASPATFDARMICSRARVRRAHRAPVHGRARPRCVSSSVSVRARATAATTADADADASDARPPAESPEVLRGRRALRWRAARVLAADGALGELDVYTEALVAASPDPSTNDADASTAPVPDPASEGFTCAELASALDHIAFDRLQAIIQREEVDRGLEVMGTMRQVVVASAGADVRAFRVPWPRGTAVFELAHADVHDAAHATLKAAGAKPPRGCSHRRVPRDPTSPAGLVPGHLEDALARAGYAPDVPSLWIVQDVGATDAERWEALTEEMADLMCAGSEVVGHVPSSMAGTAAGATFGAPLANVAAMAGIRARCYAPAGLGFEETLGEGQLGVFHGVKQRPSKMEAEYYQEQVYLVEHEYGDEEGFES